MRSDDLTLEQVKAIQASLRPISGYLERLRKRMVRRGFPLNDPLLLAVCKAECAIQAVKVHLHYLTCGDVVMRHRPKDKPH